jgi:hypothetical protein
VSGAGRWLSTWLSAISPDHNLFECLKAPLHGTRWERRAMLQR